MCCTTMGVCLGQGTGSPSGWAMLGAALGLWLPQAIPPTGCCPAPLWAGDAERPTVPILDLVRVPQGPGLALEPEVWPNFCSRPTGPHAALPTPEASRSAQFFPVSPALFLEARSWAQRVAVQSGLQWMGTPDAPKPVEPCALLPSRRSIQGSPRAYSLAPASHLCRLPESPRARGGSPGGLCGSGKCRMSRRFRAGVAGPSSGRGPPSP